MARVKKLHENIEKMLHDTYQKETRYIHEEYRIRMFKKFQDSIISQLIGDAIILASKLESESLRFDHTSELLILKHFTDIGINIDFEVTDSIKRAYDLVGMLKGNGALDEIFSYFDAEDVKRVKAKIADIHLNV